MAPPDPDQVIASYEDLLAITQEMLAHARAGEWDALIAREGERTAQLEALKPLDILDPADHAHLGRKAEVIREILALDKEIEVLTRDWMGELRELFNSVGAQQKLQKAYGTGE